MTEGHVERHDVASRRWALGVLIGIGVLLLVAAGVGAVCVYRLASITRHFNTGDPLQDAYLESTAKSIYYNGKLKVGLSPEAWQDLEKRFGGTPEFALLCNRGRRSWSNPAFLSSPSFRAGTWQTDYIYASYKRGQYDYPLLLALYDGLDSTWSIAIYQSAAQPQQRLHSGLDRARQWQQQCALIEKQHGQERQDLLRDMFSCAPGQALPYYLEAIRACGEDRYGDATTWLRKGNAAARCDLPSGVPMDLLIAQTRQGKLLGGNAAIAGALWTSTSELSLPPAFDVLNISDLIATHAAVAHDPAALSELRTALCRLGKAGEVRLGTRLILVIGGLDRTAKAAQAAYGKTPSPEQAAALAKLNKLVDKLRNEQNSIFSKRTSSVGQMTSRSWLMKAAGFLTGGKAYNIQDCHVIGEEIVMEQTMIETRIMPLFAEFERFDFTTLSWK